MNLLEQQLDYPFGETLPPRGHAVEVAPGIRWVRMALPFALDHINLWLLRDELEGRAGWTIVDCCVASDDAKACWEQVFENSLDGLPVLRVLVTHMHPDHIGLAQWLCERWSTADHECRLWISATDYGVARMSASSISGFGGEAAAVFFTLHGATDPTLVESIRTRSNYYASLVPGVPDSYRRLMDGLVVRIGGRDWTCISGYGHAPEHIALYCADASEPGAPGALPVLVSGDMVLPRISTNISVYDMEPEGNPLQLFLDSIEKYLPLPAATLTLPSHGKPFRGLHTRIGQLQDHHRDRLAEVVEACRASACSAADIVPVMFRRQLDAHQTTFAMGEALAHLHKLWLEGVLTRLTGSDGVYRFSAA
ncbi:MAG: MBL fold metallo-hydrolase [Comamonadaceae bacterium]|nr:MAG: MBL fold metallo-hydrolase [Comamonadaceae bacterium]